MRPKFEWLAVIAIGVYFVYLTGGGFNADFSHDDLMNMDRAWSSGVWQLLREIVLFFQPSPNYRPLGGLFYALCFDAFTFQHWPFRAVMLGFLIVNVGLTYITVKYLTGSFDLAILATFLLSYHPALALLYRYTGVCYDIFCFLFYWVAFAFYLRIRKRNRFPNWWESTLFLTLLILALNSKEMAVTLPVVLSLWELVFSPPPRLRDVPRWLLHEGRTAALGSIAVTAFVLGRVYSNQDGLAGMAAYAPQFSVQVWWSNWSFWLDRLSLRFRETPSLEWIPIALLLPAAFVLAGSRRRLLLFAVSAALIGALPVSFIPRRDLSAIYVPLLGVALAAALVVSSAVSVLLQLTRTGRRIAPKACAWVPLALVAAVVLGPYLRYGEHQRRYRDREETQIRAVLNEYRLGLPRMKAGSRILLLVDPFQDQEYKRWASLFLLRMIHREPDLVIHRLVMLRRVPDAEALASYDHVVTFENGRLVPVPPRLREERMVMAASCSRVPPRGWDDGWDD